MKPILAATIEDTTKLSFPLLASPKLDGIRALVVDGVLVSRNMKPIPNPTVQALFGQSSLDGWDGELICGDPTDIAAFRKTTSAVMSRQGVPTGVVYYTFDNFLHRGGFRERLKSLRTFGSVQVVPHKEVRSREELINLESGWLDEGYEGVMLRSLHGPYKHGRSTLKEGTLMKLKRFSDDEAVIIGFEEQLQNTNEQTRDALGRAERSNHQAGMVGKGTLGSLRVRGVSGPFKGVEFNVGSGMDDVLRSYIWENQSSNLGLTINFKHFIVGSKDAPRFPIFRGFRSDL